MGGHSKKKFNTKARSKGAKDPGKVSTVSVVGDEFAGGVYDESNPLIIVKKKKEEGLSSSRAGGKEEGRRTKFLTKKQRKKLQQIVDRKVKKGQRAELLQELQQYQLPPQIFDKLTPLVQVQTEGLRKLVASIEKDKALEESRERKRRKDTSPVEQGDSDDDEDGLDILTGKESRSIPKIKKYSSLKGAHKRSKIANNSNKYLSWSGRFGLQSVDKVNKSDPKVLGFDEDDDEEESSEEEEGSPSPTISEGALTVKEEVEDVDEEVQFSPPPTISDPSPVPPKKPDLKAQNNPKAEDTKRLRKVFVPVYRTPEIEAVRSKLPIIPEEQIIMESITENLVTVLAGETGSGKTTQVPQFLYEAGYASAGKIIGVTEPRRVAAMSMSSRVGTELNLPPKRVSYQIRFEGNVSPKTQIKFMTDGVLLKEMEKDFLLSKYSVICVDEAHERSLYTDLLIGLLSRCVLLRKKRGEPLKLVIMSATMRVEDFMENSNLFKSPPTLIHVPTRQFPVQIHFNKVTPENYLIAAYKKAVQIHRKLPSGGILIFVTGQQEVKTLVKKLTKAFSQTDTGEPGESDDDDDDGALEKIKRTKKRQSKNESDLKVSSDKEVRLRTFDLDKLQMMPLKCEEEDEDDDEGLSDSDDDNVNEWNKVDSSCATKQPLYVLPLYSMLPSKEQQKVFCQPPQGSRLCVVSTNVAETSLTIPSIKYVVDCGKVKVKVWDKITGVQQFKVAWESQASAEQRAGRAGRTGPGHCYRLFSSSVFSDEFPKYSVPEIQVRPVDDMLLLMKSMGIDRAKNFPYPTPPAADQLATAEKTLMSLGALEKKRSMKKGDDETDITELGKTMSYFPIGPRFAKMLALSFQHCLTEYTVALVAALSVQEVFLDASMQDGDSTKDVKKRWFSIKRRWAGSGASFLLGDAMVLLKAVGAFEYANGCDKFCAENGLRLKGMMEIRKLRKQLVSEINLLVNSGDEVVLNPHMPPPTDEQSTLLRQILLSGLPDRVARKILPSELREGENPKIYKHAYKCGELEDPVFLHPSACVFRSNNCPEWIVYQEIFESGDEKMYLRGITAIDPTWLPTFCHSLCRLDSPLEDPPPFCKDGVIYCWVKGSYGKQGWELPVTQIEYPHVLEKYKLFAKFLLEGEIFPKLCKWKKNLLSLPVTMVKPWAKLQSRTQTLLSALTSHGIHSKEGLAEMWGQKDKKFLLKEYLQWVSPEYHPDVETEWPPLPSIDKVD